MGVNIHGSAYLYENGAGEFVFLFIYKKVTLYIKIIQSRDLTPKTYKTRKQRNVFLPPSPQPTPGATHLLVGPPGTVSASSRAATCDPRSPRHTHGAHRSLCPARGASASRPEGDDVLLTAACSGGNRGQNQPWAPWGPARTGLPPGTR